MDVQIFPNSRRPGVGLRPRRESQRPLLPQHARLCPVLEAGSAAGFLVYPPLMPQEAFHVSYLGEGRYQFVYYANPTGAKWEGIFSVTYAFPVGGIGTFSEEVAFLIQGGPISRDNALLMARTVIATDDLGTPAGAVTLRGAWNFRTPSGWDTIYTSIFNMIERPIAPVLVIRVETDWYAHDSEFRYVLQPGEGISGSHSLPIGQVLFVPREETTLRDCSDEELAAINRSRETFSRDKAALTRTTPYGLPYSPHYLQTSRAQPTPAGEPAGDVTATIESVAVPQLPDPPEDVGPMRLATAGGLATAEGLAQPAALTSPASAAGKIGRNALCPCGSGRKYKKCHGRAA
jgi:hypothetical protein